MDREQLLKYKEVKNYLHNELGINKGYVDNILKEYLEAEIKKSISNMESNSWIERIVKKTISELLTGNKSTGYRDQFDEYLRSVIKNCVKEIIVDKIDFSNIKIKQP